MHSGEKYFQKIDLSQSQQKRGEFSEISIETSQSIEQSDPNKGI